MRSSPGSDEARAFRERGALVVRGAFVDGAARGRGREKPARAEPLRLSLDEVGGDPGGFWDDYCNWQRIPEYRDFIFASGVAELLGGVLGSSVVRIFQERPRQGARTSRLSRVTSAQPARA